MMFFRLFSTILFFCVSVFAVSLSEITTTEEPDSVKFVLQFDKSFDGKMDQNITDKGVVLTFHGLNVEARKDWIFNNSLVSKAVMASIAPGMSVLYMETLSPVGINSVKTPDGLKTTIVAVPKPAEPKSDEVAPIADSTDMFGWRYAVVIIFMVVLLIILIVVKKRMHSRAPMAISSMLASVGNDDIKVVSQRYIDNANKLMLIEYEDAKYLILVGSSSMVIDKFYENVSDISDSDLQKALAFTQVSNSAKQKEREFVSDFDDYKMRAEGDFEEPALNKWGKVE